MPNSVLSSLLRIILAILENKKILITVQNQRFCRFLTEPWNYLKTNTCLNSCYSILFTLFFKVLKIFKNITFIYYSANRSDDYNKRQVANKVYENSKNTRKLLYACMTKVLGAFILYNCISSFFIVQTSRNRNMFMK